MATAASTPDPRGRNRLKKESARWVRKCSPMLYHQANARGVHPSQITRELSGERRNELAGAEKYLLALARHPKCSPFPWLSYIHSQIEEAFLELHQPDPLRTYLERCVQETQAQGAADLAQLRIRTLQTPEGLDELLDRLGEHAACIMRLMGAARALREAGSC